MGSFELKAKLEKLEKASKAVTEAAGALDDESFDTPTPADVCPLSPLLLP